MSSQFPHVKSKKFCKELEQLSKKEPSVVPKLRKLVEEALRHPKTGTGHTKPLGGYGERAVWSRHITEKHRLIYEIRHDSVVFIACYGHYDDR
jgi:toxin YoeB